MDRECCFSSILSHVEIFPSSERAITLSHSLSAQQILHQSLSYLDHSLQNGGKGAGGGARGNSSKSRNNGQPSQAAAAAADNVCRCFDLGKCPNTQGPCVTSAGVTLKHVCNYRLATGGRFLTTHARHTNH
jgi:hypothetical protein